MTEKSELSKLSLARKLAEVAEAVGKVEKKGYNEQGKYHYARATDVFDEVRKALAAETVALTFAIDPAHTTFEKGTTANGGTAIMATLWITYRFHDGDSGEIFEVVTVATARDVGQADKAVYKAQTNALKYLLFQVFQISTGDDDVERDAPAPKDDEPKQRAKRSAMNAFKEGPPKADAKLAEPAPLPVPAITEDQRADIRFLNEALPKENQWGNKALRSQLVALGADGLVKELVGDHKKYHADACTHYADAPDGRLVIKRAA